MFNEQMRVEWGVEGMNDRISVIDGHAHLDGLEDLESALVEAKEEGVAAIIGVGMGIESNRKILAIAEQHPGFVLPAIGYHPWEIRKPEIKHTDKEYI